MKKTPSPSAIAGANTAEADVSTLITDGRLPLPSEILLKVGTLYATSGVTIALGTARENMQAHGVQAGIVATLHAILAPAQFRDVMIQWDVDAIKLSELLHLAGAGHQDEIETIEA